MTSKLHPNHSNRKLNQTELRQFVDQCRIAESIDFPEVARSLNFNWFTQIRPRLESDDWFLQEMKQMLESLRYKLLQLIFKTGKTGKDKFKRNPEANYIREVIKYIDSGALLGVKVKDEKPEEEENPEIMEKHLERLGIILEEENGKGITTTDS